MIFQHAKPRARILYAYKIKVIMKMMINCFRGMADQQRRLVLFHAETIARDHHHWESSTRREQDLNLRIT